MGTSTENQETLDEQLYKIMDDEVPEDKDELREAERDTLIYNLVFLAEHIYGLNPQVHRICIVHQTQAGDKFCTSLVATEKAALVPGNFGTQNVHVIVLGEWKTQRSEALLGFRDAVEKKMGEVLAMAAK